MIYCYKTGVQESMAGAYWHHVRRYEAPFSIVVPYVYIIHREVKL